MGIPQQEMQKNIPAAHSLQLGIMHRLPGALKQLSIGVEAGIGTYASKRVEQTFQFNNNTAAVVPVDYTSNVFNANLYGRLNLLNEKKLVLPYIQAKGGLYNFFSTVYIEDPNDPNGCSALQQENIINDKTMYWSAGGGLQINTGVFGKSKSRRNVMIDISVNTIRGGTIDYINTKRLMDVQDVSTTGGKPLNVNFINASTQEIHEHSVAQVYTSPLRMLEVRAGVTVNLGCD